MNELLLQLIELQSLESGATKNKTTGTAAAALRAKIPLQILGHYDRLAARGKKPLAAVNHQVCSACHMRVPVGAIMTLKSGQDIQLCETCGRYLFLPPEVAAQPAEPLAAVKPPKRTRKPKKTLAPA